MRKGRLFISGMLGFWLWLAGLPVNHDSAGQWLAGEVPRARAYVINGTEISGTVDTDTTIGETLYVNPSLLVNNGVTLTLTGTFGRLLPFGSTSTLTNNGAILYLDSNQNTPLNIVNNGSITNATPTQGGFLSFGAGTEYALVINNATITNFGAMLVRRGSQLDNYGTVTNNYILDVGGTLNNRSGGTITNEIELHITTGTLNNSGAVTNKADGVLLLGGRYATLTTAAR